GRPDRGARSRQGHRRTHEQPTESVGRLRCAPRPPHGSGAAVGSGGPPRFRARRPGSPGERSPRLVCPGDRRHRRGGRPGSARPVERDSHQLLSRSAHPRRGVPRPHRPTGRRPDGRTGSGTRRTSGAGGMSTYSTSFDDQRLRSALATGERPARPSPLASSLTFLWRAVLKIKHVPEQLFDVTAFPIMFLLMFTYLFGGALAGSPRAYLQEVLPGILVMTVTFITMYTGLTINRDIQKGVHDRFRTL